ncbi:HAMP domain-containing sensor histidine kinase [Variovorax sp. J31P179]|uniref:sensor histidine kinase n=1 Tax=Variovorax sp. J31P179 TaxID=3053508 RepID=UPI0025775381|nr:HAMP domain-containing sensor histidine kinase [Variovorax sp. J31P179]MDM0085104.1 HAMP domain-containing sensor histidine kinase [Variovorax sp. J31P179]
MPRQSEVSPTRPPIAVACFPSLASGPLVAADPPLDEREEFIRRSLINRYMRESIGQVLLGLLLCVVMASLCVRVIPLQQVMPWITVVAACYILRHLAETNFVRHLQDASTEVQLGFVRDIRPVYLVLAIGLGSSVLLFFDRLGDIGEFACWSILAGMMYVPTPRLALLPALGRVYTTAFFASALVCMLLVAAQDPSPSSHTAVWFLPLAILQWALTRRMTREIHRTQREHYGLVFDLAAQKREAVEAVQTKNRFLAAATHDIRQPAVALAIYAEHLEAYPDMHLELAPKIHRASQAVNGLFDSLFDLSKFDAGEVHLAIGPTRIADVIAALVSTADPLAREKGIELRVRVVDAMLQTDAARLQRMIGNVLANAIKYSHPGTKILLSARMRAGRVRVEVWDQGIGIPADQIQQVFSEFYRVDAATKLAPDGMGIGLSLVTRLAAALNTRLTIASVEGRGTRVSMEIRDVDPDPAKCRIAFDCG